MPSYNQSAAHRPHLERRGCDISPVSGRASGLQGPRQLCPLPDTQLGARASTWLFRNTIVRTRELTPAGRGRETVEAGFPEEGILIRSDRVTARPKGIFCPAQSISLTPGAIAAVPEGGPDTIANVVLSGILVAHMRAGDGAPASGRLTVSGTLQVEDPAQRDTFSIGNRGE